MSANVETMFSVRVTPWHGLGTIIEEAVTSDEAIRLAGLDWKVNQEDVYDSAGKQIKGYKLNYRSTDGMPLGIVTPKYKIIQNHEAFAFTDALLGDGVTYETAGSLANGKRVWMLARMQRVNLCEEVVDPYLVFTNSHDGTGAVKVAVTPIRVVCQNTLNLALRKASRHWSCMHTGNIAGKMEEARLTLMNAENYIDSLNDEFSSLKLQKMNEDKVIDAISTLLPVDTLSDNKRKVNNILNMREELINRYLYAPDLRDTEKTAFRFVNAVSDFATHKEPLRKTTNYQANMFMGVVDGNSMIDTAYRIVKTA